MCLVLDHLPTNKNFVISVRITDNVWPHIHHTRDTIPTCDFETIVEEQFNIEGSYIFELVIRHYSRYIFEPQLWSLQVTLKTDEGDCEIHSFDLSIPFGVQGISVPIFCTLKINPCVGVHLTCRLVAVSSNKLVVVEAGTVHLEAFRFFKQTLLDLRHFAQRPSNLLEKLARVHKASKKLTEVDTRIIQWNPNACVDMRDVNEDFHSYGLPVPSTLNFHQICSRIMGLPVSRLKRSIRLTRNKCGEQEQYLNIAFGGTIVQLCMDSRITSMGIRCYDLNILHVVKDVVFSRLADGHEVVIDASYFRRQALLHQMLTQDYDDDDDEYLEYDRDEWRKVTYELTL